MNASDIASIFKAYDVRGTVGGTLIADVSYEIRKVFANWLPPDDKVVARCDMWLASNTLVDKINQDIGAAS